jgi:hypothetical protein
MIHFDINWLAVIVAIIVNMVVGSVWYSPLLFGKQWSKLIGHKMDESVGSNFGYAITTVAAVIQTFILANFIRDLNITQPMNGAYIGFLLWLAFVALTTISDIIFAKRPIKLWLINTTYYLVVLVVNGALLAAI